MDSVLRTSQCAVDGTRGRPWFAAWSRTSGDGNSGPLRGVDAPRSGLPWSSNRLRKTEEASSRSCCCSCGRAGREPEPAATGA